MQYAVMLKMTGAPEQEWWMWWQPVTFVQLTDNVSPDVVEEGLQQFIATQNAARPNWMVSRFFLQPLDDIGHGSTDFEDMVLARPPPFASILLLISLAGLILVVACFNFTNTTIALSGNRLREIGMKKTMGIQRRELARSGSRNHYHCRI